VVATENRTVVYSSVFLVIVVIEAVASLAVADCNAVLPVHICIAYIT